MSNVVNLETSYGAMSGLGNVGQPQFVFVHGLGGDKNVYSPVFDHPNADGKGLLSLDLIGFGCSSRLEDSTPYTFELQANALREALVGAGINRFSLVLHSMASGLLPELLAFEELAVESLFLLESNLTEEDTGWSREISELSDDEYRTYFKRVQKAARFVMAGQLRRSHPKEMIAQWSQGYVRSDERAMRETAINLYKRTCGGEILESVKRFGGRKVYFRGLDDREWNGRDLLESLGVEIVSVPDAGHLLMLDDPRTVYSEMFRDKNKDDLKAVSAR